MPLLSAVYVGSSNRAKGSQVQQLLVQSNISNSFILGDDHRFIWFIYPGEDQIKELNQTIRKSVGSDTPIVVFEDQSESYLVN